MVLTAGAKFILSVLALHNKYISKRVKINVHVVRIVRLTLNSVEYEIQGSFFFNIEPF